MRKLKKVDKNRAEIVVEQPKKSSLKPNFLLTKTVSNILNQVKVPKVTPRKRKLETMDVELPEITPRKKKVIETDIEMTDMQAEKKEIEDSNKFAIPTYFFVDSKTQTKSNVTVKQLNVEPLILDSGESLRNLKEFIASKETNPKIVYDCKYCDKKNLKTEHSLLIHVKFAHLCVHCLKCFKKESLLNQHVKKEHQTSYCTICNAEFNKQLVKNHLKKLHNIDLPANSNLIRSSDRETLVE